MAAPSNACAGSSAAWTPAARRSATPSRREPSSPISPTVESRARGRPRLFPQQPRLAAVPVKFQRPLLLNGCEGRARVEVSPGAVRPEAFGAADVARPVRLQELDG